MVDLTIYVFTTFLSNIGLMSCVLSIHFAEIFFYCSVVRIWTIELKQSWTFKLLITEIRRSLNNDINPNSYFSYCQIYSIFILYLTYILIYIENINIITWNTTSTHTREQELMYNELGVSYYVLEVLRYYCLMISSLWSNKDYFYLTTNECTMQY